MLEFFLSPNHGKDIILYMGFIAFHRAIIRDNLQIIKVFTSYLTQQELASIQSYDGISVLDAAMEHQRTDIIDYLLKILS